MGQPRSGDGVGLSKYFIQVLRLGACCHGDCAYTGSLKIRRRSMRLIAGFPCVKGVAERASPCLFRQTLTCRASGSAGPSAPPIRTGAGRERACWIGTGWSSGSHRTRSRSSPVSGSTAKHVAQGGIQDGYVRHLQAVPCEWRNASGLDDLLQEMSD